MHIVVVVLCRFSFRNWWLIVDKLMDNIFLVQGWDGMGNEAECVDSL